MNKKIQIDKELFIKTCYESLSMMEAAKKLDIAFSTFKRYAKLYECYKPNQPGKGIKKKDPYRKVKIEKVLNGEFPKYNTNFLKKMLINYKYLENKCSKCNIIDWCNEHITLELDHIDGNPNNHKLENLRILCPNCHSQTPTFRNKKRIEINISAPSET